MDLEEFELESFRRYGDIGNEKQYVIYKGLCASKGVVFVRTPPIDLINNWLVANQEAVEAAKAQLTFDQLTGIGMFVWDFMSDTGAWA